MTSAKALQRKEEPTTVSTYIESSVPTPKRKITTAMSLYKENCKKQLI